MWSAITGIFNSSKSVEKGMDMVDKGIDAMFFTDEEKSKANMKRLQFKLDWVKALGPQSKARRYIAYLVGSLWTYLVLLAVHLYIFGYIEQAEYVYRILKDVVSIPFGGIMTFYFLTNMVRANKS